MKRLLFVVFALFLLTGCSKPIATVQEPAETTASQETRLPTATWEVPSIDMSTIPIALPEGVIRESISPSQDHFVLEGNAIGGIALLEIDPAIMETLHANFGNGDRIISYIQENINPDFGPEPQDGHYLGSSSYHFFDLSLFSTEKEYQHYLLPGKSAYYDVWFDCSRVDERTAAAVVESIQCEELTVEGRAQFSEETFPVYDSMTLEVTLPGGFSCQAISETESHFLRDGTIVGGYCHIPYQGDLLTFVAENTIREQGLLDLLRKTVFTPEETRYWNGTLGWDEESYLVAVFTNGDREYIHYLLEDYTMGFDKGVLFSLWFDQNEVDPATQREIVHSAAFVGK